LNAYVVLLYQSPGFELSRIQNLLDIVLADERIDPDRVGMWGLSLGGLATMSGCLLNRV
jgi:hypothetical protein